MNLAIEKALEAKLKSKILKEKFPEAYPSGGFLKKVIRAKCLECCNGQIGEVRECKSPRCPLYIYRTSSTLLKYRRTISNNINN